MTTLSQQLKKLALPQTRIFKQDKKRISFLFDPKEAATLDKETFFDIGCSGLDELQLIDARFSQFKEVLFSETAAEVQRAMLTKDANDSLNITLNKFITCLTPYFTLRSAHKAMEWLIYRFYIHQYNVDAVMLCILPYHDSNLFVRMVQILEIDEKDPKWYWLAAAKKSGHPIPRQTLLNHCAADLGFLNLICGCVSSLVEESSEQDLQSLKVIFTFYASVVCGAIGSTDRINDSFVGQLMPHVILGLRSRIPTYSIASMMIICQLAVKVKLTPNVSESLVKQIFLKMRPQTVSNAVSTIVVLFQTQTIDRISSKALSKVAVNEMEKELGFLTCLESLDSKTNLDNFLSVLIRCLVDCAASSETDDAPIVSFLRNIVSELKLSPSIAEMILNLLADKFFTAHDQSDRSTCLDSFRNRFERICSTLFKRYSMVFDAVIEKRSGQNDDILRAFIEICDSDLRGTEFKIPSKSDLNAVKMAPRCSKKDFATNQSSALQSNNELLRSYWKSKDTAFYDLKWWPVDGSSPIVESLLQRFELLFTGLATNSSQKSVYTSELELMLKEYFVNLNDLFKLTLTCFLENSRWFRLRDCMMQLLITMTRSIGVKSFETLLFPDVTVLAFLSIGLSSSEADVRYKTCLLLEAIVERLNGDIDVSCSDFLHCLKDNVAEMQADATQFQQVVQNHASDCHDKTFKTLKTKKAKSDRSVLVNIFNRFLLINDRGSLTVLIAGLNAMSSYNSKEVLESCADVLDELISSKRNLENLSDLNFVKFYSKLIYKFDQHAGQFLTIRSKLYAVFKKAISFDIDNSLTSGISMAALQQISLDFYMNLPPEIRFDLFKSLIDAKLACQLNLSSSVGARITLILSTINIDSSLLQKFFDEAIFRQSVGSVASPKKVVKRKRTESGASIDAGTVPKLSTQQLRMLTEVLECYAANENAERSESLLTSFFTSLSVFLDLDDKETSEFGVRMTLNCVESICSGSQGSRINPKTFDVEALVRCIRVVVTPQSHQQTFRLLAIAADLFKEELVVRLMPIFSFMGDNLFHQDDSYSFQIIEKTITTVVPALMKAYADQSEYRKLLTKIYRDFVSSSMHIPQHRRLSVLKVLVESSASSKISEVNTGAESLGQPDIEMVEANAEIRHEHLWIVIGLLIEYHVMNWTSQGKECGVITDVQDSSSVRDRIDLRESGLNSVMEFAMNLCTKFDAIDQILCATDLLRYILALPDELKPSAVSWYEESLALVFDLKGKTDKQLIHFKYEVLGFASHLFSDPDFLSKLCDFTDEEFDQSTRFFENLSEEIMGVSNHYSRLALAKVNDSSAKVWKAMQHRVKACFEKFNMLLPAEVSLNVIQLLLRKDDSNVRQCALDILNAKLLLNPTPFTKRQIPKLCSIARQIADWLKNDSIIDHDQILLFQGALYTLKLLVRVAYAYEKQPFVETLERTVALCHNWRCTNKALLANAVLCLADLVTALNVQTLPLMPTYMTDILGILGDESFLIDNELLVASCLTALQKIVAAMSKFLSPYLPDIIKIVGTKSNELPNDQAKNDSVGRCLAIRKSLAILPLRVLLPAAEKCLMGDSESANAKTFLPYLFDILSENLHLSDSDTVTSLISELTSFFLTALDFRTRQAFPSEVSAIEDKVLTATSVLALKLSENHFKPLVSKLIDWSTVGLVGSDEGKNDRLITLIRLAIKLADKLRSLFGLFAPPFIKLSSDLLIRASSAKSDKDANPLFTRNYAADKLNILLCDTFDLISKCCQYDTQSLITRERFDALATPLIEQIENITLSNYVTRVNDHLIPCLVNLAWAVGDDSAWKHLNYEILMKSRSKKPKIRLSVLRLIEQLYSKLGESISTLIPESVPFLAELMEDESEEVEQQCQIVIGVLEKIVGESLKDYF